MHFKTSSSSVLKSLKFQHDSLNAWNYLLELDMWLFLFEIYFNFCLILDETINFICGIHVFSVGTQTQSFLPLNCKCSFIREKKICVNLKLFLCVCC